jgi:hypothetical protein
MKNVITMLFPPHHYCPGSSHSHPQMLAFQHAKLSQHHKWKQFQHKHKLNPNQTHSPIVHQHVQKDAPCHAPSSFSFLQLRSSFCTSCTVPIIQQVNKNAKRIYSSLRPLLRSAYLRILKLAKQFAKQIPSYPKAPKRHLRCNTHRKGIANSMCLIRQKLNINFIRIFVGKKWRRGRVLTNVALRLGMPPCPSLWVVGGTSFTRSAALRNFNGGSPTSSTTNWHSTSFSSSAFRSRSDLPNSLAFLALASYSMISFNCLVAFSCTSEW